ncbi:hypothetical protein E4U42_001862 [Claviceps africana]|uniref:Small nuclear ribonucleoprotein Prp3 C-terminal domain-containing protein n=1 Tax=Claviceps africana TaxID=83212 RepID=A0A8K0NLV8_9HYPO|nr:hypothetical protein E4U42_001862 [Claviceps africana]
MSPRMLSQDLVEQQLAQIDLLMAMFPGEDTVSLSEEATTSLETWKSLQSHATDELPPNVSPSVPVLLTLELDAHEAVTKTFQLDITIPFFTGNAERPDADEPPCPGVRLVQPAWMSKAEAAAISAAAPKDQDLLSMIQYFQDGASRHLLPPAVPTTAAVSRNQAETDAQPLVRTWFYFPSISTRSKRADIVHYAPAYGLTGFLLSGKPGVLCLEGTALHVDAYMKFIKTESWSDIPAHHKKVTERFREHGVTRAFADMQEITDTLGERRGERANRGDMRLLEAWLVQRGLGDAFIKVFI